MCLLFRLSLRTLSWLQTAHSIGSWKVSYLRNQREKTTSRRRCLTRAAPSPPPEVHAEIVFIRGHHHQMPMVLVVGAVGGWGGYITKMISDEVIYELRENWVLILKAQVEVGGRANLQIFELEQQKQHHS